MATNTPTFYRPYLSDTESESGYTSDETDATDGSYGSDTTDMTEFTGSTTYPGPNTNVSIVPPKPTAETAAPFQPQTNSSLIMISSRDRDTNVYPQPTFFTIRLPRVFKNIRQINITQLKLLNSFFNFSDARGNNYMYINELGRTIVDASGQTVSNDVRVQIRNGTYNVPQLVSELNNALNQTPLFSDISGGLGTFINTFQGTGDYSLLFNQPGTVVYNSLTGNYDTGITMSQLIARYFQNVQTVGTINFSYSECLVAYYYPVIYEMTARNLPFDRNESALPSGFLQSTDYILFGFQGLDDPYILSLLQIPENLTAFDAFRAQNTFVQFLVNQYNCTYTANQGRLQISAPSLNQSIITDLTSQYNAFLQDAVINAGFSTIATFQAQYNALSNQNGALLEFYNFIHRQFTNTFGINFGTYTAEFFANINNDITLNNTINKRGWYTYLLPSVSVNAISQSQIFPEQISTPWANIRVQPSDPGASAFLSSYNLSSLTFSNASETTFGYTDISFAIVPTSYFRVNFTTSCRQTISAMTLPRYLTERGPGTEEAYPYGSQLDQTPMLFDITPGPPTSTIYIRTDISGVSDFNMYDISQVMFTDKDYFRDENRWIDYVFPQILSGVRVQEASPNYQQNPPIGDIALLSYRPHMFFQLNMHEYALEPLAKWKVDIVVETRDGSLFPVPIKVSRYRDRAAFMADVSQDLQQNYTENPRHVFENQVFQDVSSAVLTIDVLNNQQSYFSVHVLNNAVLPSAIPLRVYACLHDEYGVYTTQGPLDYRDMPYAELPPLTDQFTPNSAVFKSPLTSIYDPAITQIGYDVSGVSNNLLDYYIQGTDRTLFDPENVEAYQDGARTGLRYLFEYGSPGGLPLAPDATPGDWSLYFYGTSANQLRDTYATGSNNIYLNSSISAKAPADGNESLLVNWYKAGASSTIVEEYAYPTPAGMDSTDTRISLSTGIFLACANVGSGLPTDVSTNLAFQDISGFHGLSFFLNPNDIVKMNNIQLKLAYIQPSATGASNLYTRASGPLGLTNTTGALFENQATYTDVQSNAFGTWDDWYLLNRRNLRVGVFNTGDVSGAAVDTLSLTSSILTMTLEKVTQVAAYTNTTGTQRTREPEWGTYYSYKPLLSTMTMWDVSGAGWRSTIVGADTQPTYVAGEESYPGYFLTHTNINNYNFLPNSYGIAPSVGYAVNTPYAYLSSYTTDIANSYTMVPFYEDPADATWKAGSWFGVSYTREPAVADPAVVGSYAPYYGPPGIFAWTRNVSTLVLANGDKASFAPYYWNGKVAFETLDQDYNPATDLSAFGGFASISNELQDTVLFFYQNGTTDADLTDISGGTEWRWGIEQNTVYKSYDDQDGYNFLSYIPDVTVRSTSASTVDYAFHVRGYVPTSRFMTGLRLIGKNFTDFGTVTLAEIGGEISSLSGYTPISDASGYAFVTSDPVGYSTIINANDGIRGCFSHQYADALVRFDRLFNYPGGIVFGKKIGYSGVTFYLNGYGDSIDQYAYYYSTLRGTQQIYTDVLSTATGQLNAYVRDRYANILPANIINRTRFTDPLPFSMLFGSRTPEPFASRFDEWGLGWNLGFPKQDTPYLTNQVSQTFIRIVDDYVYLRLNPEMNMNMVGVSAKEDLALTREPFAEDQRYFAKILLNDFGSLSYAAVQMPKEFSPVLGKYETISLQLVDRNGAAIDNTDCDFDVVMEIVEQVDGYRNTFSDPQGNGLGAVFQ